MVDTIHHGGARTPNITEFGAVNLPSELHFDLEANYQNVLKLLEVEPGPMHHNCMKNPKSKHKIPTTHVKLLICRLFWRIWQLERKVKDLQNKPNPLEVKY